MNRAVAWPARCRTLAIPNLAETEPLVGFRNNSALSTSEVSGADWLSGLRLK
jgi:hypothetical protein